MKLELACQTRGKCLEFTDVLNYLSKQVIICLYKGMVHFVQTSFQMHNMGLQQQVRVYASAVLHDTNGDSEIKKLVIQTCLVLPHTSSY